MDSEASLGYQRRLCFKKKKKKRKLKWTNPQVLRVAGGLLGSAHCYNASSLRSLGYYPVVEEEYSSDTMPAV